MSGNFWIPLGLEWRNIIGSQVVYHFFQILIDLGQTSKFDSDIYESLDLFDDLWPSSLKDTDYEIALTSVIYSEFELFISQKGGEIQLY